MRREATIRSLETILFLLSTERLASDGSFQASNTIFNRLTSKRCLKPESSQVTSIGTTRLCDRMTVRIVVDYIAGPWIRSGWHLPQYSKHSEPVDEFGHRTLKLISGKKSRCWEVIIHSVIRSMLVLVSLNDQQQNSRA